MQFVFERVIGVERERVFAFFADPDNLRVLHAGDPAFRLLRHDGCVTSGASTWVELRVAGFLPIVLGFHHHGCDAPARFAERLAHGPFRRFDHLHEFVEESDGTRIRDSLAIELPAIYGGELAVRRLLAPAVRASFAARDLRLRDWAEGDGR